MANSLLLKFAAGLQQEQDTMGGFAQEEYARAPIGVPSGQQQPQQQPMAPQQQPMAPQQQPMAPPQAASAPAANAPARGFDPQGMSDSAMNAYGLLEKAWGNPLSVTSAYRDPEHNARVGGAKGSQHMHGNAFDLDVSGMPQEQRINLIRQARQAGFKGIGVYRNSLHFDTGPDRAWGPSYGRESLPDWATEAIGSPIGSGGLTMSTKSPTGGEAAAEGADQQPGRFDRFLDRIGMGPTQDDPNTDKVEMTGRERAANALEVLSKGFRMLSTGEDMDLSGILQGQAQRRDWAIKRLEQARARRQAQEQMDAARQAFAQEYPEYAAMALSGEPGFKLAAQLAVQEDQQSHAVSLQQMSDTAASTRQEAMFGHETAMQEARFGQETSERIGTQGFTLARDTNQNDFQISRDEAQRAHEMFKQNDEQAFVTVRDTTGHERQIGREEAARAFETSEREATQGFTTSEREATQNFTTVRDTNLNDFQIGREEAQRAHEMFKQNDEQEFVTVRDTAGHKRQVTRDEAARAFERTERKATQDWTMARDRNQNDFQIGRDEAARAQEIFMQNDQQRFTAVRDTNGHERTISREEAARAFTRTERVATQENAAAEADAQVGRNVDQATQIADVEEQRRIAADARKRAIEEREKAAMIESVRQNPKLGDMADLFEPLNLEGAHNLYSSLTGEKFKFDRDQAAQTAQRQMEGDAISEAYASKPWGHTAGQLAARNPEAAQKYIAQQIDAEIVADEAAADAEAGQRLGDYFDTVVEKYAATSPSTASAAQEAANLARAGDLDTATQRYLEAVETGTDAENFTLYEELLNSTSPERAASFAELLGRKAGAGNVAQAAVMDLQVAEFKDTAAKIQNATSQIEQLGMFNELLMQPDFRSGPVSRTLLTPLTALSELGINLADKETLTQQEVANAIAEGAISYMRVPGDIMSDQDVIRYRNSTVSLGKSPAANAMTVYALTETTRRREAKYRAEIAYFSGNNGDMTGSEDYVNSRLAEQGIMQQRDDGRYEAVPFIKEYDMNAAANAVGSMAPGTPYVIKSGDTEVMLVRGINDV